MQTQQTNTSRHANRAQQREHDDPEENARAVPWGLVLLILGLFTWGVVYFASNSMSEKLNWGDQRTLADVAAPAKSAVADGAAIFAAQCASCHQADGAGLPGVFPPLAGSEWVNGKPALLAQILLHGINGPITVKGQNYQGQMPAFGAKLSDAEIAAVLSHVRSQWGNQSPPMDAASVAAARAASQSQSQPWAGAAALAQFR